MYPCSIVSHFFDILVEYNHTKSHELMVYQFLVLIDLDRLTNSFCFLFGAFLLLVNVPKSILLYDK